MISSQTSSRYAKALLALAEEYNVLDKIDAQLTALLEVLKKNPKVHLFARNSAIASADKEAVIARIFSGSVEILLVQFMKILLRKNRFHELEMIQGDFHKLYERKKGIQEVTAVTVVPLSEQNQIKLTAALAARLGKKIRLFNELDPGMIGGIILRYEDYEINCSFKDRLAELHQKLLHAKHG